jgi:hypothetical protein
MSFLLRFEEGTDSSKKRRRRNRENGPRGNTIFND